MDASHNEFGFVYYPQPATLEVAGPATLLSDTLTNNGAVIQVDNAGDLALNHSKIIGGTINDNGIIDVTVSSTINGGAKLNNGQVKVETGQILTLDDVAVTGTTITLYSDLLPADKRAFDGVLSVNAGQTLTLTGATVIGGTLDVASGAILDLFDTQIVGVALNDLGTINVFGTSTIDSFATVLSGLTVVATNQTLFLDNAFVTGKVTNDGTLRIDATYSATFDDVAVTGGILDVYGTLNITGSSSTTNTTINVFPGGVVNVSGTVGFTGGSLDNQGTIDATGVLTLATSISILNEATGVLEASSGGTLALKSNVQNNSGGQLIAGASSVIDVAAGGGQITNNTASSGIVVAGTLQFEVATLELLGSGGVQLNGGTITGSGSNILDNDGNTIAGYGLIEKVTLQNGDGVATSTIDADSNGNTLTLDTGSISILNEATGVLEASSGGTLALKSNVQNNSGGQLIAGASSVIDVAAGGGQITNNTASSGIVVAGTLQFEVATLELLGSGGVQLNGGTITGSGSNILDNDGNTIAGYGLIEKVTLQNGDGVATSTIDADSNGNTLTLDTGSISILNEATGVLEASSGGTLALKSNVQNNSGGQLIAGASSVIDVAAGGGQITNNTASSGIVVAGTLQFEVATLELLGSGGVQLNGGTITGSGSNILDNDGNTIAGYGLIEKVTLQNGDGVATSTIDADSNGNTLTLDTGSISILNEATGVLEASSGGTLALKSNVQNNSGGQLIAGASSVIDVAAGGGQITNNTASSGIVVAGTLQFEVATLELLGSGGVQLNGGTITGSGSNILDNDGNTIAGYGLIEKVTLQNGDGVATSTIDADSNGNTLTLDTGSISILNEATGVLEASSGGTLALKSNVQNNSGGQLIAGASSVIDVAAGGGQITNNTASSGIVVAGTLQFEVATLELLGSGGVQLNGGTITGSGSNILDNDGNTIAGYGLIEKVTLQNGDGVATSTIDADSNGNTLTLDTGSISILNEATGVLEASSGGTLALKSNVQNNSGGQLIAGASSVIDVAAGGGQITNNTASSGIVVAGTLQFEVATLELLGSGGVQLNGGTITGSGSNILDNDGNTIAGYGLIEKVTLQNGDGVATSTIDADSNGNTLTLDTGSISILNEATGVLEASSGGTLALKSNVQNNSGGQLIAGASSVIDVAAGGGQITNNTASSGIVVAGTLQFEVATLELLGSGGVQLNGGTITGSGSNILDNDGNTIAGYGLIEKVTLQNGDGVATSTIDADSNGNTLTLDTGSISILNEATGVLEASSGGTLALKSNVQNNSGGQLIAGASSVIDVAAGGGQITNNTASSGIVVAGTLQFEVATLELLGSGGVQLNGGTITGSGSNILDNDGNTIAGYGLIEKVTLQNGDGVATSTIDADSNGNTLTLDTGSISILNEATGVLEASSGGTLALKSNVQNNSGGQLIAGASSVIDVAAGGGQITNNTASSGIVVAGTLQFEVATLELLGSGGVQLNGGTITGSGSNILDNDGNTIAGYGLIEKVTLQNGDGVATSTIDADSNGNTLTLDTGSISILNEATGVLEASSGGTLALKSNVQNNSGGQLIAGASSVIDVAAGGGQITNNTASSGIVVAGTLQFEVATLELLGSGGVQLNGGTITGSGSNILDNDGNTIAGYGLIEKVTLQNGDGVATSTIDADSNGNTLTLDTGSISILNEATGVLEASSGGTLALKSNVQNNSGGQLIAGASSVIDVAAGGGQITNNTASSGIVVAGTLQFEVATLELLGSGGVQLNGGTITGSGSNILDNDGNTIAGYGLIEKVTLQNGDGVATSTIDADSNGNTLTLDTGSISILNEATGVLEASSGGTLALKSNVQNNSGGQLIAGASSVIDVAAGGGQITNNTASSGIVVAGTLQFEVATLELLGSGGVQLNGGTITGSGSNILDNDGNTIAGYGLIEKVTLQNGDGTSATIDANIATKTLVLNTGNSISNESLGVLEASSGSTLQIKSDVTNSGQVLTLDGGTVELVGDTVTGGKINVSSTGTATATTLEISGNVTLTGGTLTLTDFTQNQIVSDGNATELFNSDLIQGAGTIGDATLTLDNSATIDATGANPLILDTGGNAIINELTSSTLEASSGSTLQIESAVTNSGQVLALDGGTVELVGDTVTGGNINVSSTGAATATTLEISGNVTLTGGGTVTLTDFAENRIVSNGSAAELFNSDLIQGAGTIGDATLTLDNSATIDATGTNPLILDTGTNAITNESGAKLEASDDATLAIKSDVTNIDLTSHIVADDGGTVELVNDTIAGGTLELDGNAEATTLHISGAVTLNGGVVTLSDFAQNTITIDTGASLTLGTALAIGNNTVTLVGSNSLLTNSAGLTIAGGTISGLGDLAANTNLSGYGTVSIPLDSADTVTADGGTLVFTSAVDSTTATSFDIAAAANSVLKFDAAVGTGSISPVNPIITFVGGDNGHGALDLTGISLSNFHGVIANFDDGESIDVAGATSASLEANGTSLDVYHLSTRIGTIDLKTSYAGDTFNVSSGVITVDDLVATLSSNTPQENTPISVTSVTDDGVTVSTGLSYQWLINGADATGIGATTATYTPAESDEGQTLSVQVTYADLQGNESITPTVGTVAGVADTPIVSATASAGSTLEDAATVLSGLSLQPGDGSANDAADSFTATLYVDHGALAVVDGSNGDTFLASSVTASGDGEGSGTALTITGTLTAVQAALDHVQYTPASEYEGTDNVHFTALSTEESLVGGNVGADASAVTASITVSGTADTPIVSATASAGSTLEDAATVLSGLSLQPGDGSANDAADSFTATLYVDHGALAVVDGSNGDTFLASSVTASGDGEGSGTALTITGTLTAVQAALDHVQYTPASEYEGTDNVHFTALSTEESLVGGNVGADASAVTASITVSGTADTPIVSATASAGSTLEDAATVLSGLSLQPGDGSANDAADSFTATLYVDHGALAVVDGSNGDTFLASSVTASGDGEGSGTALTITGTLTAVQAALDHVQYTPASEYEGTDNVHFTALSTEESLVGGNVGADASAVTASITVSGTADTPIVSATASAGSTLEDAATVLSGLSLQPGDGSANDAADSFTATLYVDHGALAVVDGSNGDTFLASSVTASGDGEGSGTALTITGTLTAVQAALDHVQYTPASEYEGTDNVHFTALSTEESLVGGNVGADASAVTASITVSGTADTPIVSATASAGSTLEDAATVLSGLSLQPGDGSANDAADSFTATLYVDHGALAVVDGSNGDTFLASSVTASGDGEGSGTALTITGTLTAVQAALDHVQYTPASEYEGTDNVHFTALSTEESLVGGNVGADASAVTASITVSGTADTPIVSATASAGSTLEDAATVLSGLSLQPGDGSANDAADSFTATLYVDHGALAVVDGSNGDTFLASSVTASGDGEGSGTALTITGTLTAVQAALDHVQYTPASEYEGTDNVHFTALSTEESLVGGNVGADASAVTASITVSGTADTPIVSATASAGSTLEDAATVLSGLSLQPGDGSANDAADSFTATLYVDHGALAVVDGSNGDTFLASSVTASGDGEGSGTALTITGTLTAVQAALDHVQYTPASEYEGTDNVHFTALSTEDVGTSTSAPATTITSSITVDPVATAPSAAAPSTLTLNENDSNVTISGVIVGPLAEDGDDSVSAALAVAHGTLHVDTTSLPSDVTVTGDTSGALTVAGDAADVNSVLTSLTYTPTSEYESPDTLNLTVSSSDGSNTYATTASASTTITVDPVPAANIRVWGNSYFPSAPTAGVYELGGSVGVNTLTDTIGFSYASTTNYDPNNLAGPYLVTQTAQGFDPFMLLQTGSGSSAVIETSNTTLPARSNVALPNFNYGTHINTEGLVAFEVQTTINQATHNVIDLSTLRLVGNTLTPTTSEIEDLGAASAETTYNVRVQFRQDDGSTPQYLSNYAVAWDTLDASGNYNVQFQTFNANDTNDSGIVTALGQSIVGGITHAPAWDFKSAGGIYALATAVSDTTSIILSSICLSHTLRYISRATTPTERRIPRTLQTSKASRFSPISLHIPPARRTRSPRSSFPRSVPGSQAGRRLRCSSRRCQTLAKATRSPGTRLSRIRMVPTIRSNSSSPRPARPTGQPFRSRTASTRRMFGW